MLIAIGIFLASAVPMGVLWAILPHRDYSSTDSYGDTSTWRMPSVPWLVFGALFLIGVNVAFHVWQQCFCVGRRGQTWGKRSMGIKVVDFDDNSKAIGAGRAFGRWFVPYLINSACGFFVFIDCLWPLWDKEQQALHDKMFHSRVVRA
jgi:uncharacterized RDD family membrane protein YckC